MLSKKSKFNQILTTLIKTIKENELNGFASVMMSVNNYLINKLENNQLDILLFENNKWVTIIDATYDSLHIFWYNYFNNNRVELKQERSIISNSYNCDIVFNALEF